MIFVEDIMSVKAYIEDCIEAAYSLAEESLAHEVLNSANRVVDKFVERWNEESYKNRNLLSTKFESVAETFRHDIIRTRRNIIETYDEVNFNTKCGALK